jgi:hypothetical protein
MGILSNIVKKNYSKRDFAVRLDELGHAPREGKPQSEPP